MAAFVASLVRFPDRDPRPVGSGADIEGLAEREDVNVLFILVDTLRADRMSAYGYERQTSPALDDIAERGIRFDRHLAQSSWTKASMASLWTGLYPLRAGVTRFDQQLSQQAILPAEIFRAAGFRTAGIWRNGWVSGYFGFDQGFEAYDKPASKPPPASIIRENPTLSTVGTDVDVVAAASEFLRVYGDQRWFLYLHMMDLHEYLYDEDSAKFGTSYSDVYDNSILRTDLILEQLFLFLAQQDLLTKTIVVIGSDHGEAFGERGYEGHARVVYRESTEVPLIVSLPFQLEPGVVVPTRTRNIDIWPTVLELVGLEMPAGIDGRSRVPEILAAVRGETLLDATDGFAHLDQTWGQRGVASRSTLAIARGPLRYVFSEAPNGDVYEELFDASGDPRELSNALAGNLETLAEFRVEAEEHLKVEPPWGVVDRLEVDQMQLNQLRALGYALP